MKILHTQADGEFIKANGAAVEYNGEWYYYFHFWLKDVNGTGMFEQIGFENLPQGVKDFIVQNREPDVKESDTTKNP